MLVIKAGVEKTAQQVIGRVFFVESIYMNVNVLAGTLTTCRIS